MIESTPPPASPPAVASAASPRRLTSSGDVLRRVRFDSPSPPLVLAPSCPSSPTGASLYLLVPSLSLFPVTSNNGCRSVCLPPPVALPTTRAKMLTPQLPHVLLAESTWIRLLSLCKWGLVAGGLFVSLRNSAPPTRGISSAVNQRAPITVVKRRHGWHQGVVVVADGALSFFSPAVGVTTCCSVVSSLNTKLERGDALSQWPAHCCDPGRQHRQRCESCCLGQHDRHDRRGKSVCADTCYV